MTLTGARTIAEISRDSLVDASRRAAGAP